MVDIMAVCEIGERDSFEFEVQLQIVLGFYSDFWKQKEKVKSRKVRAVREIGKE